MRLSAAERTDIEAIRAQRRDEAGIVDLRIMRQRDEGGVAVEPDPGKRLLRPFRQQRHAREALRGGEGGTGVDHDEVEVERLRHRRHGLRDMHRARYHDARVRRLDGEEIGDAFRLHRAALAGAQLLLDQLRERIGRNLALPDQPLRAAGGFGDEHGRTSRRAFGIERRENGEIHAVSPCRSRA